MKNIRCSNAKSGGPQQLIQFAALVLAVALAGLTSGCVFIPTPHYYANGSRQNITGQSTNLFQPGVTTIENVMLKLGEPDAISPDERRIAYGSKKIVGWLYVFDVDTDGSDLPEVPTYRFLNIMLDQNGVVTNRAFSKHQLLMFTGSIRGEKIKINFQSSWYPDIDVSKPWPQQYGLINLLFPIASEKVTVFSGNLMLTESTLYFTEKSQWPNGQPTLSLRYDSLNEVKYDQDEPALIVHTKDNHFHSFINTAESACTFIQSRIKAGASETRQ